MMLEKNNVVYVFPTYNEDCALYEHLLLVIEDGNPVINHYVYWDAGKKNGPHPNSAYHCH